MRFDVGSTNLTSAGSEEQIVNTDLQITWINVKAKPGNAGDIWFGMSDVTSSN